MSRLGVHRELVLPSPTAKPEEKEPRRPALTLPSGHVSWFELYRAFDGSVRYHFGAPCSSDLHLTFASLREVFPGLQLGTEAGCPIASSSTTRAHFVRLVPQVRTHYWPMQRPWGTDHAGRLLQSLSAGPRGGQGLLLQILFRSVSGWERGFFSSSPEEFVSGLDRSLRPKADRRLAGPAYHVEIRAALFGADPRLVYDALLAWTGSWLSIRGGPWWSTRLVKDRERRDFDHAFRSHDLSRFAASKVRRDISGSELAHVLPIPWRERHAGIAYAGAPAGRVAPELVTQRPNGSELLVGRACGEQVRLPARWNHLVILGRSRSGKSTLAQNLVLQILAKQPGAKVVVLEPTGELIRGIVDRLPPSVAGDAIEVDPSQPTHEWEGQTLASVPLNLLHIADRPAVGTPEFERKAERRVAEFLQAIRNAWGEQSIGGRAEFVLRAVLQSLLAVEGSNLVDAYAVLSDKAALRRLERLVPWGPLRDALRVHLPKLDYTYTISSLDKVGKIATNAILRKALCQRYCPVSFDRLLDHPLLLLNLAKGALGSEGANFLGAILLSQLWSALQERARPDLPVYLVVDEFHNYAIPAFADMLSEGARLGLHVVAITQYLNRIPDAVRSAMIGNVDAWALFSLGAEDMLAGWNLVRGAEFGWQPEHLESGLRPHQVALATHGALLKVDTFTTPAPAMETVRARAFVQRGSWRYAQPEDSEASPLALTPERIATFLRAFPPVEGRTRRELEEHLRWPLGEVNAAIARCKAAGDVVEDWSHEVGLRIRGLYHREAIDAARNEGEDHIELLADFAAFLEGQGVRSRIVPQEGGYLRPDGEFEHRGRFYNIEIECSTLAKRTEQTVRNVRKALGANRRCVIVTASREMAEYACALLAKELPDARVQSEVNVLWREGPERFLPVEAGHAREWAFLREGMEEDGDSEPIADERAEARAPSLMPDDGHASDVARVLDRATELLVSGRNEVTAEDFGGVIGANGNGLPERVRLGMALESLGIRGRRRRSGGGEKVKFYDLSPLALRMQKTANGPTQPGEAGIASRDNAHEKPGSGHSSEPSL